MTTTLQRTQTFIARQLHLQERDLRVDRTLESLGIDSLAALEILFRLEDEFGFRMPPTHERIVTFGDLVALVDRELARQRVAA